ncbi:hypothetical protein G9451_04435 [Enterobacter kobei]|uniref:hypothetical protein n=1 Tax=Enterobacter kobei TaxID=208224 RepID=UPI00187DF0E1|nr:hypothetical protein [Enterobacter kobei]MBE8915154.1 hypothetical protein [Enterobacter kobei]
MTKQECNSLISSCKTRVDELEKYCDRNPEDREALIDLTLLRVALEALSSKKDHHDEA